MATLTLKPERIGNRGLIAQLVHALGKWRSSKLAAERAVCLAAFNDAQRRGDTRSQRDTHQRAVLATNQLLAAEIGRRAPSSWRGR